MENLSAGHVFWDTWRAPRSGSAGIMAHQQRRLAETVDYARMHSRLYALRPPLSNPLTLLA